MRKANHLNSAAITASRPAGRAGQGDAPGLWPKDNTDPHETQQVTRWNLCSLLLGLLWPRGTNTVMTAFPEGLSMAKRFINIGYNLKTCT